MAAFAIIDNCLGEHGADKNSVENARSEDV